MRGFGRATLPGVHLRQSVPNLMMRKGDVVAEIRKRTLLRHPLAAVGGAMVLAGGALFMILMLVDLTSATENPYRSLVTFIFAPFIVTVGAILLLASIWVQVHQARRRGESVRFTLSIDPSDPVYMKNLWLFLGLAAGLIIIVIYSGTKAYDLTDSVRFCGETCHLVMEPQNVTYHNSPHARVPCVECHIGPGASFWVKSKFDGLRQVYATTFNTYSRPIETPIRNLRPAQETCEECHWPQQFYGDKLVTHTYYRTDDKNSPWTINLLVKIGGGNPRTGKLEGIHWHMIGPNKVQYIATDTKRRQIPWIRLITPSGDTVVYTDPNGDVPNPDDPDVEIRNFDCMDCHNRPSHLFRPPAVALNLALSTRAISPDLPYIRKVGLDLLNAEYATRDAAHAAIASGLTTYYETEYPETAGPAKEKIGQAAQRLLEIYDDNFFPEMKTDYRARENHLSHFVGDGCFRCHDGVKQDKDGNTISHGCKTCHLIIAQGPSEDIQQLEGNLSGLDFTHPEDIDEAWREMKCTECHDRTSGY